MCILKYTPITTLTNSLSFIRKQLQNMLQSFGNLQGMGICQHIKTIHANIDHINEEKRLDIQRLVMARQKGKVIKLPNIKSIHLSNFNTGQPKDFDTNIIIGPAHQNTCSPHTFPGQWRGLINRHRALRSYALG